MEYSTLFSFAIVTLSQTISIGPGVALVINNAFSQGLKSSIKTSIYIRAGEGERDVFFAVGRNGHGANDNVDGAVGQRLGALSGFEETEVHAPFIPNCAAALKSTKVN